MRLSLADKIAVLIMYAHVYKNAACGKFSCDGWRIFPTLTQTKLSQIFEVHKFIDFNYVIRFETKYFQVREA